MSKILMIYANEISPYDLEMKPLAGTQTAFIELSKAFSSLGHQVTILSKTEVEYTSLNYCWKNIKNSIIQDEFDLMIVNVSVSLFQQFKYIRATHKILWIHNDAKYLLYWSRLKYLIKFRPLIVFSGKYHASTLPFFIPTGGRIIIPLGLSSSVFTINRYNGLPPNKKIYFTSNPLRSLRWLVDLWVLKIHPQVPTAELHIFSDWKTYGKWGESVKARMKDEIDYVSQFTQANIFIRNVVPKNELFKEMLNGRAMFYKGDKAETFCLSIAEGLALGLPAVVTDLGCMNERVKNGINGFIAQSDDEFVRFAIDILKRDELWMTLSKNAKELATDFTWDIVARKFLSVIN